MRQGLGDTLAKGIKVAAEAMGMADQAIHVKGLEPSGVRSSRAQGHGAGLWNVG